LQEAGTGAHAFITQWNVTQDSDIGGLERVPVGLKRELSLLFSAIAGQESSFLSDLHRHVFASGSPLEIAYPHTMVKNCPKYSSVLKGAGAKLYANAAGHFVEAGSGFGFGFQVYCGCRLLLTTGGGFGSGMTVSQTIGVAPVMGGLGGGGGVQMFKDGAQDAGAKDLPTLNAGGGGGGSLLGCAGSTDFGQLYPVSGMSEAAEMLMAPQVQSCAKEDLSIVGGGGGGMGFTVTGKESAKEWVAAYGGGLNLKFMSANAEANDAKCGGKLLHGSAANQNSGNYTQISNATAGCRAHCKSKSAGLAELWKCTCPCTRAAFQALNLTFASKMICK